jgi:hypothetical protein
MTVEEALAIAESADRAVSKWGKQAVIPHRLDELLAALRVLSRTEAVNPPGRAEITKLKRQLAAAEARVARLSKRK